MIGLAVILLAGLLFYFAKASPLPSTRSSQPTAPSSPTPTPEGPVESI